MTRFTITFKVDLDSNYALGEDKERLEVDLKDLIKVAVLPTLNLDLVPLTFEVKRARG